MLAIVFSLCAQARGCAKLIQGLSQFISMDKIKILNFPSIFKVKIYVFVKETHFSFSLILYKKKQSTGGKWLCVFG